LNTSTELLNRIIAISKLVGINVNLELVNPGCEWDVKDSDESGDEN
jgi:hypothetical protein